MVGRHRQQTHVCDVRELDKPDIGLLSVDIERGDKLPRKRVDVCLLESISSGVSASRLRKPT